VTITEQRTLVCTVCGWAHTADPRLWACAQCGAPLRFAQLPVFQPAAIETRDRTIWRYRHTFPVGPEVEPVTLGEGGTPLVALDKPSGAARVLAKLEYLIGLTQLAYKVAPDGHRDATSGGLVGTLPATGTVGTSQLRNS